MTAAEFDYMEYDHWIDKFTGKIDILNGRIEALIDVENPEIELFNIGTEQVLKVLE